eukprot:COSAG01_NODE_58_length_30193_cov_12.302020_21_plen_81_part_00
MPAVARPACWLPAGLAAAGLLLGIMTEMTATQASRTSTGTQYSCRLVGNPGEQLLTVELRLGPSDGSCTLSFILDHEATR